MSLNEDLDVLVGNNDGVKKSPRQSPNYSKSKFFA